LAGRLARNGLAAPAATSQSKCHRPRELLTAHRRFTSGIDRKALAYRPFPLGFAVGQHRRRHRFTVDIGAVETADVNDPEFVVFPTELGVPAADGDVVEEDVNRTDIPLRFLVTMMMAPDQQVLVFVDDDELKQSGWIRRSPGSST
jgi:hypothetical protein